MHIYSSALPSRRVRDYENLELKEILDVVAAFVMVDDSGALCDAYNTTELGETDYRSWAKTASCSGWNRGKIA